MLSSSRWPRPTPARPVSTSRTGWANAGPPGELAQVLPSVRHIERASTLVTRESTAESVVAGPDLDAHVEQLHKYAVAGYDEVYVANMGPHYLPMIEAYGQDVLPATRNAS